MKIFTITTVILFALILTSCNSSTESQSMGEVTLNNGEKWMVNAEMTPHILAAEKLFLQYDGNDYEELADQLESQNKKLIKSCTMKGESHDELHKWLHPHIQLIERLDDAENIEEADKIVAQLKTSFQSYHTFFQ